MDIVRDRMVVLKLFSLAPDCVSFRVAWCISITSFKQQTLVQELELQTTPFK